MILTPNDYEYLQKIMNESPRNQETIQKLLDSHQYTVSKISHEIRNPLALVYSTLQLIESQHPEAKDFKYWREMRSDIEFMIQLLQELSAFNNGERLQKTLFSSYDFLSKVCLSFAASCTEDSVQFTSEIPDSLPMLYADKLKLQEVILNILKNAREAISGTEGLISIKAEAHPDSLEIQIADTGCGIPEERLDTLFDAFVTYKSEGTGLGLAIAQRTIQAHNGMISVKSKLNKGTCFIIKLPITNAIGQE